MGRTGLCVLSAQRKLEELGVVLLMVILQKKQTGKEVYFVLAAATSRRDKQLLRTCLYRKVMLIAASKLPYLDTCSEIFVAFFILP